MLLKAGGALSVFQGHIFIVFFFELPTHHHKYDVFAALNNRFDFCFAFKSELIRFWSVIHWSKLIRQLMGNNYAYFWWETYFFALVWFVSKSDNLQYNTLGGWVAGTNDSSTNHYLFQARKTEVWTLFSKFLTAQILFWEYLGVVCFRPKNQSFL